MNNQFLTFQAPISIKILEFIGQTNRHKVRTQLNQSSTIISATPIAVYQFFHLTRYFLYLVLGSSYLRPSIAIPCATLLASLEFSFLITVSASPSTHISRKPISTAIVTACKHALASAIIGSEIFFHGRIFESKRSDKRVKTEKSEQVSRATQAGPFHTVV